MHETRLNNIQTFSPYRKENTARLHDNDRVANAFKEIIAVYYENHMKPINTLCGQNTELLNVKAGGTCRLHSIH
jgi:hypothetical protein